MMTDSTKYVDYIVSLAREIESADPFDWSDLSIDEETAYKLVATNVLDKPSSHDILCATVVKLCVENLILNLKLIKNVDILSRRLE